MQESYKQRLMMDIYRPEARTIPRGNADILNELTTKAAEIADTRRGSCKNHTNND